MMGSTEGEGFKTLIVEDNNSYRKTLRESLQVFFPSMLIEEAADGNEALQKVAAFCPKLIFMDIQLPGKNGLQLTREIKANYSNLVVIILTNHDIPEYREAALQCGADSFIAKDSLRWEQLETLVLLSQKPGEF